MTPPYTEQEKRRDSSLRRTYNITLEEYRRVLASQGDACFICRKPLEGHSNAVDHDHKSGLVRGILCGYCNHRVLGRLTDWQVAERITAYLKDPPAVGAIGERKVPGKAKGKRKPTSTARAAGVRKSRSPRVQPPEVP